MIVSILPKCSTVPATIASIWSRDRMSVSMPIAGTPIAVSSPTVRCIFSAFHSATTTLAPALPRWFAMPRPTPCPEPVTMITRPSTLCIARAGPPASGSTAIVATPASQTAPNLTAASGYPSGRACGRRRAR